MMYSNLTTMPLFSFVNHKSDTLVTSTQKKLHIRALLYVVCIVVRAAFYTVHWRLRRQPFLVKYRLLPDLLLPGESASVRAIPNLLRVFIHDTR